MNVPDSHTPLSQPPHSQAPLSPVPLTGHFEHGSKKTLSSGAIVEKLREGPQFQWRTPHDFEFNRVTLPITGLPQPLAGLRVLHMTDLHLRAGWARAFDELIERVRADPPDLILFTGDLVEHHFDPRPAYATAKRLVSSLPSRHGTYGILGNHDGDLLGPMLEGWGLRMINGQTKRLSIHGGIVELVGVPGVHRRDMDHGFLPTVPPRSPGSLRIVLSHYPDAIRKLDSLEPDVVLTGHTHGGQLCLPGGIPIFTHDSLPRHLAQGIHRTRNTWLIVGRGFGFSSWTIRTFCPAEVIEVRFARGQTRI